MDKTNKTQEIHDRNPLPLLSKQYSNNANKFNYKITRSDIDCFNQYHSLSQEMIEYCIYDLLASEKYKERQGMKSLYIIFDDRLNDIINYNHKKENTIDLEHLIKKTCFFIPTYNINDGKWSLVIIQNIYMLFNKKYKELYKQYNSTMRDSQMRIIFISASNQRSQVINVIDYFEKLFIDYNDNNQNRDEEGKCMIDRDMLDYEIEENMIVIQLPTITEFECAFLLIKTIFGGIKSINIDSYINTLVNNNYDLEEIIEMKSKLLPELKHIFQTAHNANGNKNTTISTNSKINSFTIANHITHSQIQPSDKKNFKAMPINQSQRQNQQVYKKEIFLRSPSIATPSHRVILTESDLESHISSINKLDLLKGTESNETDNQLFNELDNSDNINQENSCNSNNDDSKPSNDFTTPVKYSKQICQTEPLHMRLESWPLTPKHEIKEIKMPIIKQNLDEEHNKASTNSRNNANYLSILLKDSSMLSLPTSHRIAIEKFDLETMRNMAYNHKLLGALSENEEEVLPRNTNMPRKSNRKPLESKSTMNSNQLFSVRDYSTNDIGNDGLNNKDNIPSNPCNNCGWENNCVIF